MSNPKIVLITGTIGRDDAILAQIILEKGSVVHGMRPYSNVPDTQNIDHLPDLQLHYGDLIDDGSLLRLLKKIKNLLRFMGHRKTFA